MDQVQTGALSESLNITVENFAMAEPVDEPVDPTGGIRATNESGKSVRKAGHTRDDFSSLIFVGRPNRYVCGINFYAILVGRLKSGNIKLF